MNAILRRNGIYRKGLAHKRLRNFSPYAKQVIVYGRKLWSMIHKSWRRLVKIILGKFLMGFVNNLTRNGTCLVKIDCFNPKVKLNDELWN